MEEEKDLDQNLADNDFAEKFWKMMFEAIIKFLIITVISIALFRGNPDLIDSIINLLNQGKQCL